jgi:uncharacterized membrane protein YgcG
MSLNPKQSFGDKDASKIDEAIAKSVVAQYVGAKNLRTLTGHFKTARADEFEAWFKKWGKSDEDVNEIPGFVYRDDKDTPIRLRLPGDNKTAATFEAAIHETIHWNSAVDQNKNLGRFQTSFGANYNEGVTEYFTERVLGSVEGLSTGAQGVADRDQLALANGLVKAIGESDVADAYFKDEARNLHLRIQKAFTAANLARSLPEWLQKRNSKNPQDLQKADQLLQAALAHPAASGSGAGSGSGGSSGSGGGSASSGSGSSP